MPARQSEAKEDQRVYRDGEKELPAEQPRRRVLTAERMRSYRSKKLHWVPCPEFGEGFGVFVPTFSSADRVAFETETVTETKKVVAGKVQTERSADLQYFNERLVVRYACDENGSRLFNGDEDLQTLKDMADNPPATAIHRIADKISDLMGWTQADLDDLVGN